MLTREFHNLHKKVFMKWSMGICATGDLTDPNMATKNQTFKMLFERLGKKSE
jgi:hypothetical protein